MGCLRRLAIAIALLWNVVSWILVAIVIGDSKTLGETAIIHKNDALTIFVASLGGIVFTLMLAIMFFLNGRHRRRTAKAIVETPTVPKQADFT